MIIDAYRFGGGGGATDPLWSNVISLLHFDGADLGTSFPDEKGILWSRDGAVTSTASPLFGSACGLFSTDHLLRSDSDLAALGTGDFVIELAISPTTLSAAAFLFDFRPSSSNGAYPCLFVNPDGSLSYFVNTSVVIATATGLISTGSYYRVALERVSGLTTLYVNGTSVGTWSDSTNYIASRAAIAAGNQPSRLSLIGRVDEWRVTKGAYRYNGNYTPATEAFPGG